MPQLHEVQPGECLASIAAAYGFTSYRPIYEAPENADLRAKRKNPNIVFPGDRVVIPDLVPRTLTVPTGQVHTVTVDVSETRLVVQLLVDEAYSYVLRVGDDERWGTTNAGSPIDQPIAADADDGGLRVWPARFASFEDAGAEAVVFPLALGALDPVDTISGVQQRLTHLGYRPGPIDGIIGPLTHAAVAEFQEDNPPLAIDGDPGPLTQAALLQKHGC